VARKTRPRWHRNGKPRKKSPFDASTSARECGNPNAADSATSHCRPARSADRPRLRLSQRLLSAVHGIKRPLKHQKCCAVRVRKSRRRPPVPCAKTSEYECFSVTTISTTSASTATTKAIKAADPNRELLPFMSSSSKEARQHHQKTNSIIQSPLVSASSARLAVNSRRRQKRPIRNARSSETAAGNRAPRLAGMLKNIGCSSASAASTLPSCLSIAKDLPPDLASIAEIVCFNMPQTKLSEATEQSSAAERSFLPQRIHPTEREASEHSAESSKRLPKIVTSSARHRHQSAVCFKMSDQTSVKSAKTFATTSSTKADEAAGSANGGSSTKSTADPLQTRAERS